MSRMSDARKLANPTDRFEPQKGSFAEWICVASGGALGALARAACQGFSEAVGCPAWASTAGVNTFGALLLGALLARLELTRPRPRLRAFLAVGLLGSYTTFSTLVAGSQQIASRLSWLPAPLGVAAHLAASLAVGIGAFQLGAWAASRTRGLDGREADAPGRRS